MGEIDEREYKGRGRKQEEGEERLGEGYGERKTERGGATYR